MYHLKHFINTSLDWLQIYFNEQWDNKCDIGFHTVADDLSCQHLGNDGALG